MADANTELNQRAIQIANDLLTLDVEVPTQIRAAEAHVADLKARLAASQLAHERSLSFSPTVEGQLQCPVCWVKSAVHSPLSPRNGLDHDDPYFCKVCGTEFSFEG
jgi:hypothetical protein